MNKTPNFDMTAMKEKINQSEREFHSQGSFKIADQLMNVEKERGTITLKKSSPASYSNTDLSPGFSQDKSSDALSEPSHSPSHNSSQIRTPASVDNTNLAKAAFENRSLSLFDRISTSYQRSKNLLTQLPWESPYNKAIHR